MFEFKHTSDTVEQSYSDIKSITERQHAPILEGLKTLSEERGWVMEVLPLVARQCSVRDILKDKECREVFKTFGISTEDKNHLQAR
jgi:hypothetical protein